MKTIITIVLVFILGICLAQNDFPNKPGLAVYGELGGKGYLSINTDFSISGNSRLGFGLTYLDYDLDNPNNPEELDSETWLSPGIMYYHLKGRDNHYFELGLGISISPMPWKNYSKNDSATSLHGCIGYRYQNPNGLLFRAGFTPFYRFNWAALPLGGISLGYSW